MNLKHVVKSVTDATKLHSPEILTGLGIAGMITSTVLAVRATPKALKLIEQEKKKQDCKKLSAKDMIRVTWKCYIPSAATGIASAGCIICALSEANRRYAAIATAYNLSESALREYQEKVIETVGEKKEREIRDAVAEERIRKDPVKNKEVIITGRGETLCYDTISGRYFKFDIEKLRKIETKLNKRLGQEMYISLNEFYYEVGLQAVKLGDDLGWNVDDEIDFSFSSQLAEDDTPCLVIDYRIAPRYDFRKLQ